MYEYRTNRENQQKVKQWAKDTGYPIPGNCHVTKAMVEAYNEANDEDVEFFASNRIYPKTAVETKGNGSAPKQKPDFFFNGKRPTRPAPVENTSGAAKRAKYLHKPE